MSKRQRNITRDGLGKPIIGRLEEVFGHRTAVEKKFKHVKSVLRQMRREHQSLFRESADEFAGLCEEIDRYISRHAPFARCPQCDDIHPVRTCLCRGKGWVTSGDYSEHVRQSV